MIIIRSIQITVLKVSLFILAALLFGKHVILPALKHTDANVLAYVLGGLILLFCQRIIDLISGVRISMLSVSAIKLCFPKSVEELRHIGVKTELDFAYAMMKVFEYRPVPLFSNALGGAAQYFSPKLFRKSVDMFEEMFGRKPSGTWSLDWNYIASLETSLALTSDFGKVPFTTFINNVSDDVKKYYNHIQCPKVDSTERAA